MSVIGKGVPAFAFPCTTGSVRYFRAPSVVIDAIDSDLESTIALVESGGTTFLSPILGRLGGIVCRDGTLRSHDRVAGVRGAVPRGYRPHRRPAGRYGDRARRRRRRRVVRTAGDAEQPAPAAVAGRVMRCPRRRSAAGSAPVPAWDGGAHVSRVFRVVATLAVTAVAAMSLLLVGQTLLGLVGLG